MSFHRAVLFANVIIGIIAYLPVILGAFLRNEFIYYWSTTSYFLALALVSANTIVLFHSIINKQRKYTKLASYLLVLSLFYPLAIFFENLIKASTSVTMEIFALYYLPSIAGIAMAWIASIGIHNKTCQMVKIKLKTPYSKSELTAIFFISGLGLFLGLFALGLVMTLSKVRLVDFILILFQTILIPSILPLIAVYLQERNNKYGYLSLIPIALLAILLLSSIKGFLPWDLFLVINLISLIPVIPLLVSLYILFKTFKKSDQSSSRRKNPSR